MSRGAKKLASRMPTAVQLIGIILFGSSTIRNYYIISMHYIQNKKIGLRSFMRSNKLIEVSDFSA